MGTRLYYKFFGKDLADESVFESQMDMLVREIGDRGKKPQLSEAVPPLATPRAHPPVAAASTTRPARAPTRAPELATAPAPAPAAAVAALRTTPERSFTPSAWSSPATPATQQAQVAAAGAWHYNRPCAQQHVGNFKTRMVRSGR